MTRIAKLTVEVTDNGVWFLTEEGPRFLPNHKHISEIERKIDGVLSDD